MKWLVKTLFYFLPFFVWHNAFSTEYQFLQYRVEDGLTTDIIKCVAEDSWGYIWIGTDQGLLQYNGHKFKNYPAATNSPFIKDFIRLKDGRLLVLDDLGLTEIINEIDTVVFKRVIEGTRNPTDSTLWYPKSLFEDDQGNLWVSEPQSVVVYDGSGIKRITFDTQHNSSSFIRSFSFAQLPNGRVLIASNNGGFFTYDLERDTLIQLESTGFTGQVNHMKVWNNEVYVAGTYGLYKSSINLDRAIKLNQIKQANTVSYIQPLADDKLLLASFLGPTFIHSVDGDFRDLPFELTTVNQAFLSGQGDIWLSTEKGLVLLRPQIFTEIKNDLNNVYIEAVMNPKGMDSVYFLSKEHIRVFKIGSKRSQIFKIHFGGYYLSGLLRGNKLWVSNTSHIIAYNKDGTSYKTFDFAPYGRYIFDMCLDKNNSIWFTQEASTLLKEIDIHNNVKVYGKQNGINKELTVVRADETGIYAGSNSLSDYLYFKKYGDTTFTNISKPLKVNSDREFRVEDIAFDNDTLWLATSVGLFRQTPQGIEKVNLDERFDDLLTKVVLNQPNTPYIWFANSFGLIQYNKFTGEANLYDESHGLLSNSISSRGLLITSSGLWVGTANGLAYSDYDFKTLMKTPSPYVVEFFADNKKYNYSLLSKIKLPSSPYLEMIVSSPVYPGNKVHYQYKINGDSIWTSLSSNNLLTFSKLGSGHYNLSFRAKKYGNYTWSDPTNFGFTIQKSFHETLLFQVAIILAAIMLVIGTRYATTRILRKRQQALERLVAERTEQLARTNKNLMERNRELDQFVYSTSHDLSAPLKSIRGLINIASYEKDVEVQRDLLKRMNTSVARLEKFIKDVISYSRNVRLEVKKSPIQLRNLVNDILEHISHIEYFPQIKFAIDIEDNVILKSDETRVRIILNNLISNAVKFQRIGEVDEPEVKISYTFKNKRHEISVEDNGCGISEEHQDKIFDMFFRANTTSDGSGLGLYILKETVRKLGGSIKVKSKEGEGSAFVVRIP